MGDEKTPAYPPLMPNLVLTAKEELAVICERLKTHINEAEDQTVKIRLDIAIDMIRLSINRR